MVPTDNEAALSYDPSAYTKSQLVSILSKSISAFSLLFFLLAIFARKLVGIELMAVIQVCHLSLVVLQSMNPCFAALTDIWFVHGLNYFNLASKGYLRDSYTPLQVKGISLYSRFTENYNFTFFLIFLPLLVSLICHILCKTVLQVHWRKKYQV